MWVVFYDDARKKIALELSGEETLGDVTRVLNECYDYSTKITYQLNGKTIEDKFKTTKFKDLDWFKEKLNSNSKSPSKDLIQIKFLPDKTDPKLKGPNGELYKAKDITIGRRFKQDDKLSPSSRSRRESSSSRNRQKINLH